MAKTNIKTNPQEQLTPVGRFVHWADSVDLKENRKIIGIVSLIFFFSFVIGQQDSNWRMFRNTNVVRAEGDLPQFSPKKDSMASGNLGCQNNSQISKSVIGEYSLDQFTVRKNIENLISNKPMRLMIDAVAGRDSQTASYLVAIAKKESNWGKFSPKNAEGKECYNYWGFRGGYKKTKSGYSCFDSPEQAVQVVGDRIQYLSKVNNFNTPEKMSVWKCGYDCSWDNPKAVKKWIADVALYYKKINPEPLL